MGYTDYTITVKTLEGFVSNMMKNYGELVVRVEEWGFLPLFRCELQGFSVEELSPPELWWTGEETDPWSWRQLAARDGRLAYGKLFTVHLNDQNGIKYDQDKSFGVENLRSAFNQVRVLMANGYGSKGEYVGLDVKAMRTTSDEDSYEHLKNSLDVFKALEEKVARWDYEYTGRLIAERKFEQLEMYTMNLLMGIDK